MMLVLVAVLFLTAVAGLPTQAPIVAIIPQGTNVNVPLDNTIQRSSVMVLNPVNENLYHRMEFHFVDFQMNQTAPAATNLLQNLEIFANITFENQKASFNGSSVSEGGVSAAQAPSSPEGFTQLFNGLYNGPVDNKISLDKTIVIDMCGFFYQKGNMDVWIRPTNGAASGAFREGFYSCSLNWNFGDKIIQQSEAAWSGNFQCNSGNLNNYSFRLWYQVRFFNIDPKTCQPGLQAKLLQ